ncbi:zinc finger protein 184-like [Contarinia nasturtii]|uniref:zinc finger protein 184-like n=1 Tax=Contarinia nasturtii TaxID=265458 RepID=UPI0012D38A1C|nr:zinc finger protein 184-like [Contarinia nasturtii]
MRKKVGRPSKGVKSKLKDASTQTDRYVEYMPLPIIIDIKSENESSDDDVFDAPNEVEAEVFESLKIEIGENNFDEYQEHSEPLSLQRQHQLPPPVEQLYFEEKFIAFDHNTTNESEQNMTVAPQESMRKRKQQTDPQNANGVKAKKSKNEPKKPKTPKERKETKVRKERKKRQPKVTNTTSEPLKLVECSLCKFTCKRPSHLKRHMVAHTGERPWKCQHCPKQFAQKTDLNRHQSIHSILYEFHCGSCGRGFPDEATSKKHETNCKTKRYSCEQCTYVTFSIGNLELHMRKHTGERPFACDVCERRFTRVSHLNQHVKLHAEDFDLHCSNCGRGFIDENTMVKHQITCKNRQFECHFCHDAQYRMDNLKRHIKTTHMGFKEYMCEYCSKKFPAKSSLNKHIQRRHQDRLQP